jgi:hypothetical protein
LFPAQAMELALLQEQAQHLVQEQHLVLEQHLALALPQELEMAR